jgi:hypothetical protein
MKIRTIVYFIIAVVVVYFITDYIRLTPSWRMYGLDMFTKTEKDFLAKPTWGTEANADMPKSGEGIFPESPYVFYEGWHLFHINDWKNHLQHLQGKPDVHGLEIGSYEGMSSVWALEHILTHPTSTITCIDIFDNENIEARFDHNVIATGTPEKIIKVKGPSEHMIRMLEINRYDYVYIDGCHLPKWALSDAVMSWETLKSGGLMIIDDYKHIDARPKSSRFTRIGFIDDYLWNKRGQYRDSPRPAVDAFLNIYAPYLDIVFKQYQIVIRKK